MTGIYFGMKINKQDKKIISQLVDDSNKYTNTKIKKHDVQIAFNTFELFKFLLASNDVFHQSLATAVHVKAQLKCPLSSSIKMTTLISHSLY